MSLSHMEENRPQTTKKFKQNLYILCMFSISSIGIFTFNSGFTRWFSGIFPWYPGRLGAKNELSRKLPWTNPLVPLGVPILRNWHIKRSNIGNIILQLDLDVRFYSYMICCIYIHDILMISLYDLYDYHLSLCSIVILSLSVLLPFPHQKNPLRLTHRSWWKPRRCQVWLGWKKHKEVRNSFI